VDLQPVSAAEISPLQSMRRMLQISGDPQHAAGNFYWILALLQNAQEQGCRVLLTGQVGNAGMSWSGEMSSRPLIWQLRSLGWRAWIERRLKDALPDRLRRDLRYYRQKYTAWYRSSAIHPDFARRLDIPALRRADPREVPLHNALEHRCNILKPGRSHVGALWAETGAAFGLEVRDPSADARLLAFTFSVPDWVFFDPHSGLDRWLIRQAMQGRLPDEVRLNRRRGRQAGDLVPRLRACAVEVETALDELERGPAAAYLDVTYMRQAWQMIQTQDTPEAFRKAVTVLARGIMAGLFVNLCLNHD
jgi:asparagine synthase (glutamine-hydrolysing)